MSRFRAPQEVEAAAAVARLFETSRDGLQERLDAFPKYVRRPILTRFLALYEITQESCATRVAARTRRHPQTVMEWLHLYNSRGPEAVSYHRTGPPFAPRSRPASVRWCAPPRPPQPGPQP